MFSRKQLIILIMLLLAGLAMAAELLYIDYMVNYSSEPFRSFCNIDDSFNCDAVAASAYSHFLGVPVAFIGVAGNLTLLAFLFVGTRATHARARMKHIYTLIFWLYALGCAALALVSFLFVPALCIVCMSFWGVSVATFVYLAVLSRGAWRRPVVLARETLTAVLHHKAATLGALGLFLFANAYAGYHFSYCGCHKKGEQALACEGFDPKGFSSYLGRSSAKIDVVVYTDFQCPWCKRAHYAVVDMVKKYEKQIRFVRKDLPLDMSCNPMLSQPFHDFACKAAFFAKCAGLQGKYWEYHDELYRNQELLSDKLFLDVAKMLSLDLDALRACAASDEVRRAVQADIAEAVRYGVEGTPTFRIFGELHGGMINESILEDYVSSYPALKPEVLRRILAGKARSEVQLVDVQDAARFAEGHLEGAVNIPLARLRDPSSTEALKPHAPTLLYDHDGRAVNEAFELLKARGFSSLHTLFGGYLGLKDARP